MGATMRSSTPCTTTGPSAARRRLVIRYPDAGPRAPWRTDPWGIERRDVEPCDVAELLRGMLGLAPDEPAPGELAAAFHRGALPRRVAGLDAGAWIAWCLVGLAIFGERSPSLRLVRRESSRVVMVLAMARARGNVSAAARTLAMTRKVLRDNLERLGLLPWRAAVVTRSDDGETGRDVAHLEHASAELGASEGVADAV